MHTRERYFLLIISGLLLGAAFPPLPLGLFAFIGFLPLFLALEHATSMGQVVRWSYIAFWFFHGASNWWVSSWQAETDPYLMASGLALWFAHPLFFAVPVVGYMWVRKRRGRTFALCAFPFLWVAFEWLHSLGEASYPWQALGYTQILHTTYAQIADIGGVWLLSFVVVVANVLCAHLWFIHKEQHRLSVRQVGRWSLLPAVRWHIAALVLLLVVPILYGWVQKTTWGHEAHMRRQHSEVRMAVLQPNINPWKKWEGESSHDQVLQYMALQDSLVRATGKPNIAVWSETAIPYRLLTPMNDYYFAELQHWVDTSGVALLTGFPDDTLYTSVHTAPPSARQYAPEGGDTLYYDSFNAAMMVLPHAPRGVKPPVYKKMKLTPFAERLPFADVLTFAISWVQWGVGISGWGLGPEQHTLNVPVQSDTARIGCVICIESIYPDFVADFVRKGANVLVVITNDGWYNYTAGPDQHFWIAAMRAIETRRYIGRSANTGLSGFITPTGEALQQSRIDTKLGMVETLPLLEQHSLYVQYGDWLPMLACFGSVVVLVATFSPAVRQRHK